MSEKIKTLITVTYRCDLDIDEFLWMQDFAIDDKLLPFTIKQKINKGKMVHVKIREDKNDN